MLGIMAVIVPVTLLILVAYWSMILDVLVTVTSYIFYACITMGIFSTICLFVSTLVDS